MPGDGARLIAALGELDARRLCLGEGCSSLFTLCTQVRRLSEHAAYLRIEAARSARKWPLIVGLLADGALHLTAVSLLAPHLTADNHEQVLEAWLRRSENRPVRRPESEPPAGRFDWRACAIAWSRVLPLPCRPDWP